MALSSLVYGAVTGIRNETDEKNPLEKNLPYKTYLTDTELIKNAKNDKNGKKYKINKSAIEELVKKIDGKTFFVNAAEAESIKPGKYSLADFIKSYNKIDKNKRKDKTDKNIEKLLESATIEIKPAKPFALPLPDYKHISPFGNKRKLGGQYKIHAGIDFSGPSDTIVAPAAGTVVAKSYDPVSGYYLIIEHGTVKATSKGLEVDLRNGEKYLVDSLKSLECINVGAPNKLTVKSIESFDGCLLTTFYCHCQKTLVRIGATVNKGDKIAIKGNTGRVITVKKENKDYYKPKHLHFAVKLTGKRKEYYVNPIYFINFDKENNVSDSSNLLIIKELQDLLN